MKEDFVPQHIAKKLLDKDYPMVEVPTGSRDNRSIPVLFELPEEHSDWQYCKAWWIPTFYQVLKWLREEKNIVVSMYPYYGKYVEVHWNWDVRTPVYRVVINSDVKQDGFDSYEQAALAGIEYTLNNII